MVNQEQQQFLNDLEKKLWTGANKLLPSLDAAVYLIPFICHSPVQF